MIVRQFDQTVCPLERIVSPGQTFILRPIINHLWKLELVGKFSITDFDRLSLNIEDTQSIKLFNACIAVNDLTWPSSFSYLDWPWPSPLATLNDLDLLRLVTLNGLDFLQLVTLKNLDLLWLVTLNDLDLFRLVTINDLDLLQLATLDDHDLL